MAEAARQLEAEAIAVPAPNAPEAALAGEPRVVPLVNLKQLALLGTEDEPLAPQRPAWTANGAAPAAPDLADLRGQPYLRYALEVAAAGGHSLLIVGPPGAGKSLAARRLPSIMPPLGRSEAMEVLRIASACGRSPRPEAPPIRPFRAPHHTISTAGLVGGGSPPRAGEVTLSHRGVLFLDELGEFSREALEALRQPLEEGRVTIVRARHAVELPCRFMLVAASNPCPCGRGEQSGRVRLPAGVDAPLPRQAQRGPRRPDRHRDLGRAPQRRGDGRGAQLRFGERSGAGDRGPRAPGAQARIGRCNADMSLAELRGSSAMTADATVMLAAGHTQLGLSGRGHDRVLRLSRTIADLEGSERVSDEHVARALTLRRRGLE